MKRAAKVFIWIGMIFQFFLVYPIVVGIIALKKLETVNNKEDLKTISILTLIFCNVLAGIFMLNVDENDLIHNSLIVDKEANLKKSKIISIVYISLLTTCLVLVILSSWEMFEVFSMLLIPLFVPVLFRVCRKEKLEKTPKVLLIISIFIIIFEFILSLNYGLMMPIIINSLFKVPMLILAILLIHYSDYDELVVSEISINSYNQNYHSRAQKEIEEIKRLYEDGLITKEEYDETRKNILNKYYK